VRFCRAETQLRGSRTGGLYQTEVYYEKKDGRRRRSRKPYERKIAKIRGDYWFKKSSWANA